MRIAIESTDEMTTIDGVECRLWLGVTEGGNPVEVFVHRIGTGDPAAHAELAGQLGGRPRPRELADIEAAHRRRVVGNLRNMM